MNYAELPPTVDSLVLILEKLRAPGGCPWDRAQTSQTLSRCLTEECAELLEAIDAGNQAAICDELGDCLLNIVLQAVVAKEEGHFDLTAVIANVNAKMIRRHAHVFGDESAESATDALHVWEKIKSAENRPKRDSLLDGMPNELSALNTAEKIQRKAAKVGFDWASEEQLIDKLIEELEEFKYARLHESPEAADAELGDIFFVVANLARFRNRKSAEELLRAANRKFVRRFKFIESELRKKGIPLETATLAEMDALWNLAKTTEAPL
ncbi:MAG: nucleoside triphosphate pyrophosphohydrolase [Victivallaceae bacterium]